jgi:hypothetical protein
MGCDEMKVTTKVIRIKSRGPINALHGVHGPILTEYTEKTAKIFRMLSDGLNVVEVMPDKSELPLTVSNFDTNNVVKKEVVIEEKKEPVVNNENNHGDKVEINKYNNYKNNKNHKYDKYNKHNRPDEKKDNITDVVETEGDELKSIEADIIESN